MKSKFILLLAVSFVAMIITTSCNSSEKKGDATTTSMDTMAMPNSDSAALAQDWEKFKAGANEKIREQGDSIRSLKMKIKKADKKTQAKMDKDIQELQRKNDELKARMDLFKVDTRENWDKFKKGFNADMDTVGQRLDGLFKGNKNKSS